MFFIQTHKNMQMILSDYMLFEEIKAATLLAN